MTALTPSVWRAEVAIAGILFAVFAILFYLALGYPRDARLFPMIVTATGLLVMGGVLTALLRRPVKETGDGAAAAEPRVSSRIFWTAMVAAPLYGVFLLVAGFYVASAITLVAMPYWLGYRRIGRLVILSIGTVAGLGLLFGAAMDVRMPPGLLGQWVLERFIYTD